MAKLIEKVYGDALFELAAEEDKIDMLFEQSDMLCRLFEENPGLMELLNHPQISKEEKLQVLTECFDGRVDDALTGFLVTVLTAGRQKFIPAILEYFKKAVKEYKCIGAASVTTAKELSAEQKKAVEARLLEITKYKSYEMHYIVDPSIIGGMIIRIGDKVVDSSIKSRLEDLSRSLKEVKI